MKASRLRTDLRPVVRLEVGRSRTSAEDDAVAVEEPLEIRVDGEAVAVTMRTPGDDAALALGFLFAEGLLESYDDVGSIAHCGRPGDEGFGNTIDVRSAPGVRLDPDRLLGARRGTLTTAACGVCGRKSIDDLLARIPRLDRPAPLPLALLVRSVEGLAEAQVGFARTGGMHAAAAMSLAGHRLAVAEDVGRHNAVDKVVGALLEEKAIGRGARPGDENPVLLVVSGRISFEIIQKAAVAGIGAVAGISAPTRLAIDLAVEAGILLAGFVRGRMVNVYAHPGYLEAHES